MNIVFLPYLLPLGIESTIKRCNHRESVNSFLCLKPIRERLNDLVHVFEQLIEVLAFPLLSFLRLRRRPHVEWFQFMLFDVLCFIERSTSLSVCSTLLILKLLLTKKDRDHTENSFFSPWERGG